jgi:hypothetical protein
MPSSIVRDGDFGVSVKKRCVVNDSNDSGDRNSVWTHLVVFRVG